MTETNRAEALCAEQVERWTDGECPSVESFLEKTPDLADEPELLLDLIYNEFLLRERFGETPSFEEFEQRFPKHATALFRQIELHRLMASESTHSGGNPGFERTTGETVSDKTFRPPMNIPAEFGRYRIERLIGRGGMGAVYHAYDSLLGRPVALKVMLFPEDVSSPHIQRFYREAQAAAAFDHPNLCPVFDVGEIDGVHYLTMPLLRGESLASRLKESGRMDWPWAVRVIATVARALDFAHEAGVIHRDLKPSNIVFKADEPVIIDFGLVHQQCAEMMKLTPSDAILGTPAYLAPEQVDQSIGAIGPTTDVYALGTVLYELLVGTPPFPGPFFEVIRATLKKARPSVRSQRDEIPPELDRIVGRAMSRDPPDRFPSMAAFADALDGLADSPDSQFIARRQRMGSRSRLRRRTAVVATFVLVAMLAAAWFVFLRSSEGPPSEAVPSDQLQVGSVWSGRFRFRAPHDSAGDVRLRISSRSGSDFEGTYNTEEMNFEWHVAGTIRGRTIHWHFTKAIRDNPDATLVEQAFVDGTIENDTLRVIFRMPSQKSTADMSLTRER